VIFAAVNSMAAALGHAATQATAADARGGVERRVAAAFTTRIGWRSGALPVGAVM